MPSFSPTEVLLVTAVMTAGAAVQGSAGFGISLVVVPLLMLIDPHFVPGPLLIAVLALVLLMAWRDRAAMDLRGLAGALLGRIPGTAAGAAILVVASQRSLSLLIGGLILLAVALSAGGLHPRRTLSTVCGAGFVSGFMGTVAMVGGPPIALIYQKEKAASLRGTLSGFFFVGALMTAVALVLAGKLGEPEVLASLVLLPGVLLGFLLSCYATRVLDKRPLRPFVLAMAAAGGLAVIVSSLR